VRDEKRCQPNQKEPVIEGQRHIAER